MSASLQPLPLDRPGPPAGVRAARLPGPPHEFLAGLAELGPVVLQAANGGADLSVEAALAAPQRCGDRYLLHTAGAGLWAWPQAWTTAFALDQGRAGRRHESLRFLDHGGEVALTVALTAASDRGAYRELAAATAPWRPRPAPEAAWQDGVTAIGEAVAAVDSGLVGELLDTLADAATPVRLMLPGNGLWLTATTVIGNPRRGTAGAEVHGAGVRLRLDGGRHVTAGIRRLPCGDGQAHVLDLYGAGGERMLRLAGQEVAGGPEDRAWRTLIHALLR